MVPLYVKFIGTESYGLIALFATLFGVLRIVEAGMAGSLNRELAMLSLRRHTGTRMRSLTRTFELVYWIAALILGGAFALTLPAVVGVWLTQETLPKETIRHACELMGFVIAVQWPQGLYIAGLFGLQRHVRLNLANIAMSIIRSGGAVLVLWRVSPTLEAFLLWQIALHALTTLVLAVLLWRQLPPSRGPVRVRLWLLRGMGRFVTGLTATNTSGVIVAQMDKILLSHLLPLRIFGIYAMASVMAAGLTSLGTPIYSSLYPRFAQLVAAGNEAVLADMFHRGARMMSAAIVPAASVLIFFAPEILRLWVHDPAIVASAQLPLRILVGATAILSICSIPYTLLIAKGQLKFPLRLNLIWVVLTVPLIIVLANRFGMVGAASVRLVLNFAALLLFGEVALRRSLPGQGMPWYRRDIAEIALPVVAVVGLCRLLVPSGLSSPALFAVLGVISSVALLTGVITSRLVGLRVLAGITAPRSAE